MSNEQLFWRRVAETRDWCAMHLSTDDLKGSLRTIEVGAPSSTFSYVPSWNAKRSAAELDKLRAVEDDRRSRVDALSDCRAKMLVDAGKYPAAVAEEISTQKFLVYLPGINLADGAAAVASKDYFDVDNIPPWDTWLMYFPAYSGEAKLISWVPPELTKIVDYAVRCNPEQCIFWATAEQLFS